MKIIKKAALAAAVLCVFNAYSQVDLGFGTTGLTGWTLSPSTGAQLPTQWNSQGKGANIVSAMTNYTPGGGNTWTITPYSGNYMAALQPTGSTMYTTMATAFGLSTADKSAIQSFLVAHAGGGQTTPTNASYMSYSNLQLTAGTKFTVAWNFVATDYTPWNDTSITSLVPTSGGATPKINGYVQDYSVLGAINPGAGNWSTGSYGSTGWQIATYEILADGTYTLGFGAFNLGDTALSPIILVSGQQGTTLKNGQSFGPIASNDPAIQAVVTAAVTPTPAPAPTPPAPTTFSTIATGGTVTSDTLAQGTITASGGILQITVAQPTVANPFVLNAGGLTVDNNGQAGTLSGVISGEGQLTINNSGTGGSITLTAQNTYTGATTVNAGATLNNTGSIASSSGVTNNGVFNNSGQAPNVTNTGAFTNSGTAGDVNNSGLTVNSGTVGAVNNSGFFVNLVNGIAGLFTNSGTATNAGTVGAVTNNAGTFTNTGIAGDITNNSGIVNNSGTAGAVNNAGTFNNTGTAGDLTNSGTATNAGTVGTVNNSGTLNVIDGGSTGAVNNSGQLTFNGSGSLLSVANTGTFDFTGPGTSGDITNSGIFNFIGSGMVGDVTNSGTFNYAGAGTVGGVTNSGTFNLSSAGSAVTVANYTQTGTGQTVMNLAPGTIQKLTVTGTANLGGAIAFNAAPGPYQYGTYPFLTAQSVTGNYSTLSILPDNISPLGVALVETGTSVGLKITPSAAYTLSSLNQNVGSLMSVNNMQMSVIDGTLNYDCSLFGEQGLCISAGARYASDPAAAGGSLTIAKRANANFRYGAFVDQGFNNITSNNVTMKTGLPTAGIFAHWNEDSRGFGWNVHTSLAYASNSMTINRTGSAYSESATGSPSSSADAVEAKLSYNYPLGTRLTLSPYFGLRYTQLNVNGYTESGAQYPLTYKGLTQSATDALAGVGVSYNFGRVVGSLSAGVVQNLSYTSGAIAGSSGIVNLGSYNVALPGSNYTSVALGAGLTIDVAKNQYLNVGIGWQQKSLINTNVSSFNASYMVGF